MKIKFDLTAGVLIRSSIRESLQNSRQKIEFWYPGSKVLLTENKGLFESYFYFEADNLPDTDEVENTLNGWLSRIKEIAG